MINIQLAKQIHDKEYAIKTAQKISYDSGMKWYNANQKLQKINDQKEKKEFQKEVSLLKISWDKNENVATNLFNEQREQYEQYKSSVESYLKTLNIEGYELVLREDTAFPQVTCKLIGDKDIPLTDDKIIDLIFTRDLICNLAIERMLTYPDPRFIKGVNTYKIIFNKLWTFNNKTGDVFVRDLI